MDRDKLYFEYLERCNALDENERYARGHGKTPRTKTERQRLERLKRRLARIGYEMSPHDIIG